MTTQNTTAGPHATPAPRRRVSRRGLLIGAGATAAGLGIGAYAGTRSPEISFASGTFGTVGPRVLVAYDSSFGSTGEIARRVAERLGAAAQVDLRKIDAGLGVSGYDAVVFGAPIQADVMKKSATQWLADRSTDMTMPHALFMPSASFGIDPNRERQVAEKTAVLTAAAEQAGLDPVGMLPMGGVVDFSKMSVATGLVYRVMSGTTQEGDFRDYGAVDAWIDEIQPRLLG